MADDYWRRGATPAEAQQYAGVARGAAAKLQATALGVRGGLRFLSLTTGVLGLAIALLRWLAPGRTVKPVTR